MWWVDHQKRFQRKTNNPFTMYVTKNVSLTKGVTSWYHHTDGRWDHKFRFHLLKCHIHSRFLHTYWRCWLQVLHVISILHNQQIYHPLCHKIHPQKDWERKASIQNNKSWNISHIIKSNITHICISWKFKYLNGYHRCLQIIVQWKIKLYHISQHKNMKSNIIDINQNNYKWCCTKETTTEVYHWRINSFLNSVSPHFHGMVQNHSSMNCAPLEEI